MVLNLRWLGLMASGWAVGRGGGQAFSAAMTPSGECQLRGRKQAQAFGNPPGWGWLRLPPPWDSCRDKAQQAPRDFLLCLQKQKQMTLGQGSGEEAKEEEISKAGKAVRRTSAKRRRLGRSQG